MRRLELARVFRLTRKLGPQHGPARLFRFVPRDVGLRSGIRVKLGLQTQNFGAAGRGSFVRLAQFGGEGLDLVLARRKLCSFRGKLLGRGVGE
jgi:hypothetical protein